MRRTLEHAMRSGGLVKSPLRVTPSPYLFFSSRFVSSFAFVLMLAVVGGSTAYAAEGSVPGDALYAMKVNVNERVAVAFAASPQSRAAVHARLAERRMEEAQVLAVRGTLSTHAKEELEAHFEEHAKEVERIVSDVELEDPVVAADIEGRFNSAVQAHSALITRLAAEGEGESRRESEGFAIALRNRGGRLARVEATALRAEPASFEKAFSVTEDAGVAMTFSTEAPLSDDAVAARIELSASTTLEEAEDYFSGLKERLDATTSARTKAQLSNIREFIKRLHRRGAEEKEGAEKALKDAVRIKTFIEAQDKFKNHSLLPAPDLDETQFEEAKEDNGDEEDSDR